MRKKKPELEQRGQNVDGILLSVMPGASLLTSPINPSSKEVKAPALSLCMEEQTGTQEASQPSRTATLLFKGLFWDMARFLVSPKARHAFDNTVSRCMGRYMQGALHARKPYALVPDRVH